MLISDVRDTFDEVVCAGEEVDTFVWFGMSMSDAVIKFLLCDDSILFCARLYFAFCDG